MWRPKDWGNNSYDCSVCDTEPEGCPSCGGNAYEAGADAILEALKKQGKHTDGQAPTLSINVLPEQRGWLVFIPDEEGVDKE